MRKLLVLTSVLLLLAACTPVAAPAPAELMADDGEGALAGLHDTLVTTLGNLTYSGILGDEPVTLVAGVYAYTEPDSVAQPFVRLLDRLIANSDLNSDGAEDAVALLEHESSGTGRFTYLVPVLDVLTEPAAAPALMLGDRIQMKSLAIVDGQVVAEYIAQGPGDGQCCPTYNVRSTFAWQDGALVETGREELSKVALTDLDGMAWRLVDLGDGQPPLPATEITLQVDAGQISGSAGCNTYNAEVTSAEAAPQTITVGPIATTMMMMCEEPVATQETTYLARLGGAVQWGYDGGLLAIAYELDGASAHLRFEPMAAAAVAAPADTVTATAAADRPAGFSDAWEPVACEEFALPKDVVESSDCGYVTVPELHANPDGPAIQLAVVRVRAIGENPAPDPLFMEQGGPGGSTILTYPGFYLMRKPNLLAVAKTRDLVFVEQRGTKYSKPSTYCPEQTEHNIRQSLGELADDDYSYLQVCHDRLIAEGVNLDAYNSVENAADMYSVAEVMGYDAFNYWGTSYGTLLGQYVISQAQEHTAKLRSAILDATVAPAVDFNALSGQATSHALRNFLAACAADEICSRDYPDLETMLFNLVDELNANPVPITLTVPAAVREVVDTEATIAGQLDGEALLEEVQSKLNSYESVRGLPQLLYLAATEGEYNWLITDLAGGLAPGQVARGMYMAVLCSRLETMQTDAAFFAPGYPQLAFLDDPIADTCALFPVAAEEPFAFADTSTPTLVLNGAFDAATPAPYGDLVAGLLDTATSVTFRDTGHGSLMNNPCAAAVSLSFLADPTAPVDSSCVAAVAPIFTALPTAPEALTLTEQTLENGVIIALPAAWSFSPSSGSYSDLNDATGTVRTGAMIVRVIKAATVEEAMTTAKITGDVLAADQPLGAYQWTIVDAPASPLFTVRYALAPAGDGETVIQVGMLARPDKAAGVFAALLEPILSSVSFAAP